MKFPVSLESARAWICQATALTEALPLLLVALSAVIAQLHPGGGLPRRPAGAGEPVLLELQAWIVIMELEKAFRQPRPPRWAHRLRLLCGPGVLPALLLRQGPTWEAWLALVRSGGSQAAAGRLQI